MFSFGMEFWTLAFAVVAEILIRASCNQTEYAGGRGLQAILTKLDGARSGGHGAAASARNGRFGANNIFIQQVSSSGTSYILLGSAFREAYFHRPIRDVGRKYVLFKDSTYAKGSGHYIVLVRVKNPTSLRKGEDISPIYEAFNLHFTKTVKAFVTEWSEVEPSKG